jgi:hypothetical protein
MAKLHFLLASKKPRQHGPYEFHAQACFVNCVMTDVAPQVLEPADISSSEKEEQSSLRGGIFRLLIIARSTLFFAP